MKLKSIIPNKLHKPISFWRSYQRNLTRDRELSSSHSVELDQEFLDDLRVVANRSELLERLPKNSVAAEVGVAEGAFSRQILDIVQPATLHLIDLWHEQSARYSSGLEQTQQRLTEEIRNGIVKVHRGLSWVMLAELEDNSLDWAYLDAAHDYESVKADLAAVLPKVKDNGWILGHDYTRWGSNGINRYGVVEAVNEFCVQHRWKLKYLTHETHRHISYAIQPE